MNRLLIVDSCICSSHCDVNSMMTDNHGHKNRKSEHTTPGVVELIGQSLDEKLLNSESILKSLITTNFRF